jgi:hypothetical protein
VSGNVNLAALQIVNAANIQVQGTSAGIPVVQPPNVSGALAASNAAGTQQQNTTPAQNRNAAQPSIIIVEVLGFGGADGEGASEQKREQPRSTPGQQGYDPNSMFQIVGTGELNEQQQKRLFGR